MGLHVNELDLFKKGIIALTAINLVYFVLLLLYLACNYNQIIALNGAMFYVENHPAVIFQTNVVNLTVLFVFQFIAAIIYKIAKEVNDFEEEKGYLNED